MSSQELADCLLHHWQNLWPLPAAERVKRIAEIQADMEFEEQQQSVAEAMAEPELAA